MDNGEGFSIIRGVTTEGKKKLLKEILSCKEFVFFFLNRNWRVESSLQIRDKFKAVNRLIGHSPLLSPIQYSSVRGRSSEQRVVIETVHEPQNKFSRRKT